MQVVSPIATCRRPSFVRLCSATSMSTGRRPRDTAVTAGGQAALRIAPPSAMASHHTAALIWGGDCPTAVGDPPHRPGRPRLPGGRDPAPIATSSRRTAVVLHRGLRVTSPERTVCDLARTARSASSSSSSVTAWCDASVTSLRTADPRGGRLAPAPGRRLLQPGRAPGPAAALTRRRSHALRMLLVVLAGLPEPTVNHILRNPDTGDWLRTVRAGIPRARCSPSSTRVAGIVESEEVWAVGHRVVARRSTHRTWSDHRGHRRRASTTTRFGSLRGSRQARRDRGAAAHRRGFSEEWRAFFPGVHPSRR